MKDIIHLALRTEYSFKQVFGRIEDVVKSTPENAIGVADINNTFSHVTFYNECKKADKKPIFGVRLMVVNDLNEMSKTNAEKRVKTFGPEYIFIAKNLSGLEEIYSLVKDAWENFYYMPRIEKTSLKYISNNVYVISGNPYLDKAYRIDYLGLSYTTNRKMYDTELKKVAICDNDYINVDDDVVHELLTENRGEKTTHQQSILTTEEWYRQFKDEEAINNTHVIAMNCNVELPEAPRTKYDGFMTVDIWCQKGADKRGIDLTESPYKERYEKEITLIMDKGYGDYFLIVADMIKYAKSKMMVGPGRGSSSGSLVCYLMDITEINPFDYDLVFERFIDINRHDLPDIDIDFNDEKRELVFKYVKKKYGSDCVALLGTISTYKPKIAISDFSKVLGIAPWETIAVKDSIIDRSGGDARAKMRILDTFDTTEAGKEFIKKFPEMKIVSRIEGHARHTGTHAAGVIVCNEPIHKYCGVNVRDGNAMLNKPGAEQLGLLKIDCLGLRTLSIVEECCKLAGIDHNDLYTMELDDPKVYQMFNDKRYSGIFQYEGQSLQHVANSTGTYDFNDIVATTALARPGAMNSGGTEKYIKYKNGIEEPIFYGDIHKKITGNTMGIVIYQEQMMRMAKEVANMSWKDVSALRRASSKSLGDEFFSKYMDKFVNGAIDNGHTKEQAEELWQHISTAGSWIFNMSHAVAYSLISYWTAYCKTYYPLEFAVANLNHARTPDKALKLLRDMVVNDGLEFIPINIFKSDIMWTVDDGKMLGGLTNLKGIGIMKARKIKAWRNSGEDPTPGMEKVICNPKTDFDILFPARYHYGEIYDKPLQYGLEMKPTEIINISDDGTYTMIGRILEHDLRDLNDYQGIQKRNGKRLDGDSFYLRMVIEDDTSAIVCMVNRFDFERLNCKEFSESIKDGETWVLIKGIIKGEWKTVGIKEMLNLTEWENEGNVIDRQEGWRNRNLNA